MTHPPTEAEFIIGEYQQWLQTWAADRTIKARVPFARARMKEWGLEGFTARNIGEFLGRPREDGRPKARWSRATYHAHLTDFCKWLVASEYLDENPMDEVRAVKRPTPNPRPLTEVEAARVLAIAQGEVRDWVTLALCAGLRAMEIAKIRGEDVSEEGIYVLGKGDVEAMLPCHPDIWAMAQRYPRQGYWFPGSANGHVRSQRISLTVGALFSELGIEGGIHRCRHLYGSRLLRSGVNVRRVQKLLRHARLETTATYTAVDEDELRAAINLLPSSLPPIPHPPAA
ncbi:tyrosine-type recombinase/integrase [Nocardioides sp.]|uniref:tyrosine-type recombinase/integrase n=1 Tax=Nocardioides sp. TaxID=35761 RepID=UPI0035639733